MKRRPVPRKKKNNRPEPDPKHKHEMLDKKTKKYGAINIILEEEVEEFAEGPEV